jgi:beta-phosphoglucomutase-like phosphatase (HAD superfamily)
MIKNIIFDFDGVLVDSEILVAKAMRKYLAEKNITFEENEFSKFAGKKTFQVISELSSLFNILDKQSFFNDVMSLANDLFSKELEVVFGVNHFLENTNHNRFIGSNSNKERIKRGLKIVGIDCYFNEDSISSFDLVGKPKPEPDVYQRLIDIANLDKKETIIIEDSAVGIQAGVATGVKVIGLTAGKHWHKDRSDQELLDAGAYAVVKNYKDMLLLINKL